MDFDSWRPEDTARRFAIMFAASVGTFSWMAVWLAYEKPIWLALLAGLGIAVVAFFPLYLILKMVFKR